MRYEKIDPIDYPLQEKQSWWIVHPNSKGGEFIVPAGAVTACLEDFMTFKKGTIYRIFPATTDGWVCVAAGDLMVELPQYLFGRHFDAEIFVRGIPTAQEIDTLIAPFSEPKKPVSLTYPEVLESGVVPVPNQTNGKWQD